MRSYQSLEKRDIEILRNTSLNVMRLTNALSTLIKKLPVISEYLSFKKNSCYPAGHYYSPIISVDDIKKREFEIWDKALIEGISGIDLQTENQIKLAAHNIYVLGQMWAFRRWELRKLFTLEEYIEIQTELIIGGIKGELR